MKHCKRLLAFLLVLTLCFPMTAFAYDATDYNKVMSSVISQYFISCQPGSALEVQGTTIIKDSNKSPNYTAGVFDLPRLTPNYYWSIPTDDELGNVGNAEKIEKYGIQIPNTVYPVLAITGRNIPDQETFTICVRSADTNDVVKTINIMASSEVTYLSTPFVDCSDSLLEKLLDNDAKRYDMVTTVYDPALHKNSVVMPNYVVTADKSALTNPPIASRTLNWTTFDYAYDGYLIGTGDVTSTIQPSAIMDDANSAAMLLFSKNAAVSMLDDRLGVVIDYTKLKAAAPVNDSYKGAYIVFRSNEISSFGIKNKEIDSALTSLDNISLDAKVFKLNADNGVDILGGLGIDDANKSLVIGANLDNVSLLYNGVVPIDGNVSSWKYTGAKDAKYNFSLHAMAYGGVSPQVATLECTAPADQYTVYLWYKDPVTNEEKQLKTLSRKVGDVTNISDTVPNNWSDWQFDSWCTDSSATTPLNAATYFSGAKANDSFNLYAKFKYVGGTYKVQFHNDATNTTSNAETYECRNQPTLPTVGSRTGYLFKNWQIVDTVASTEGTPYDPATFVPQKDKSYIFKTFWDVQGVIVSVTPNKTEYYVGDSIDKNTVVVTVQDSNDGNTRNLSTSEFTLSPTTVSTTGANQVQVTYNKSGATGTFTVTGKEVTPVSLKASYSGSTLEVGSSINKRNVTCTVAYNNGTTKTLSTTDFDISPTTVANAGTNTITARYQGLSTTFMLTGSKKNATNPTTDKSKTEDQKLTGLTATYKGQQPYVGDILKANDFQVTANYSGNTTKVLSSTDFVFSPSYVRNAGSNTITITYGGKTATVTIEAKEKSTVSNSPTGTGSANVISGRNSTSGSDTATTISTTGSADGTTATSSASTSNKDKGTSKAYLNGANILHMGSLTSDSSISNSTDILSEIASAGSNATTVNIELYNGAEGNEITQDMLTALHKKKLTMNVSMKSPADNTVVGRWVIDGKSMEDTNYMINPNITFDKISKGSETLYYMAIVNLAYPKNVQLTLYPELDVYDSGKVVRLYECSMFRDNSRLLNTVRWADESNPVNVNIYDSTSWCLSDAASAYTNGSALEADNSAEDTTVTDETEQDTDTENGEDTAGDESFDFGNEDDSFNFDDTEDVNWTGDDTMTQPKTKSKAPMIIMIAALATLIIGGGAGAFFILKSKGVGVKSNDGFDDDDFDEDAFEDDEDEIDEEDEDDFEDEEE